jgi:hypothetical protein
MRGRTAQHLCTTLLIVAANLRRIATFLANENNPKRVAHINQQRNSRRTRTSLRDHLPHANAPPATPEPLTAENTQRKPTSRAPTTAHRPRRGVSASQHVPDTTNNSGENDNNPPAEADGSSVREIPRTDRLSSANNPLWARGDLNPHILSNTGT